MKHVEKPILRPGLRWMRTRNFEVMLETEKNGTFISLAMDFESH